jgi:hypothetical protein
VFVFSPLLQNTDICFVRLGNNNQTDQGDETEGLEIEGLEGEGSVGGGGFGRRGRV